MKKYIRPERYRLDRERLQERRYKRTKPGMKKLRNKLQTMASPDIAVKVLVPAGPQIHTAFVPLPRVALLTYPSSACMYELKDPVGKSGLQAMNAEPSATAVSYEITYLAKLATKIFSSD